MGGYYCGAGSARASNQAGMMLFVPSLLQLDAFYTSMRAVDCTCIKRYACTSECRCDHMRFMTKDY